MTIEFQCPACLQPLRVPNEVAGKNGKCPQCATIFVVPATSTVPTPGGPGSRSNPFTDDPGVNPYDVGGIPARHIPELGPQQQFSNELPVVAQPADVGVIISLSFSLWQRHLGLLVGTTLVTILVSVFLGILQMIAFGSLDFPGVFSDVEFGLAFHLLHDVVQLTSFVVQTFFWVGQVQICLKLARNQPAEFVDLFLGADRYFPVLAAALLVMLPVYALDYALMFALSWGNEFGDVDLGILLAYGSLYYLLLIGGVVVFWPWAYLVIDRKASILESYIVAFHVTNGNRWTTVLLALVSALILLTGYAACFVGLLFALPLLFLLWSTAYLIMAGQIPSHNWLHQPSVYR